MGPSGSSALSRSEGAHCSHARPCRKRFGARTITHSCVIPRQRQDCSQIPQPCRGSYKFCRLLENSTGLSQECRELFSTTSKWQNTGFHTHLCCTCGTVTSSACPSHCPSRLRPQKVSLVCWTRSSGSTHTRSHKHGASSGPLVSVQSRHLQFKVKPWLPLRTPDLFRWFSVGRR